MSFKYSLWNKYLISKELTKGKVIPYEKIMQQIVKKPDYFTKRMQIRTMLKLNKTLQEPKPLKFKLNEFNPDTLYKAAHNFIVKPTFWVDRTHTSSLPVYSEYKQKHLVKRTIVRKVSGNLNDLVDELKKITSNSPIKVFTGRIEIDGLHVDKVKYYLTRLGF